MSLLPFLKVSDFYVEIGHTSLKALHGPDGVEIALDRTPNGRLTPACAETVRLKLAEFLRGAGRGGRMRAICGLSARGVSLRKLTLPPAPKENFERVLALQIEKDLPLGPTELAWGYYEVSGGQLSLPGTKGAQELIVAAARKEGLQEYIDLFTALRVEPVFTVGLLAASSICPRSPHGSMAVLDLGRSRSELIVFEDDIPVTMRSLSWGGDLLTEQIAKSLGVTREEVEQFKRSLGSEGSPGDKLQAAILPAIGSLANLVKGQWTGTKLYLVGGTAKLSNLASALEQALGGGVTCQVVTVPAGPGHSATTVGLQRNWGHARACPALVLATHEPAQTSERIAQPSRRKWAAAALLLALACLSIRYAEAYLKMPRLARRLDQIKAAQAQLPEVDRELAFLQYLETNQPPYLPALALMASAAPRGSRLDSASLTRRGDFSARGTMATSQQATEFRSKLIDSGLFSNVVLEEQTPVPNQQQKVTVRVSARWKTVPLGKSPPPVKALAPKTVPKPVEQPVAVSAPAADASVSAGSKVIPTPK